MPVPLPRRIAETLGLAVIFFITGRLALLLAVPPGYASPIWPPAGIALGALLILGRRAWLGIWLGSFALNLSNTPDLSWALVAGRTLAVPAAIAAGSTLQALVGWLLLRRFGGWPHALVSAREVAIFLALGGPVACVVAPTIGVSALALAGLIPANYLFNWMTWWSGDVLGVLIFAPLLALWSPRGQPRQAGRLAAVGVPMAAVCALAVLLFAWVERWERDRISRDFHRRCRELVNELEKSVQGGLEVLHATAALFADARQVRRDEFRRFAAATLARHPEMERLMWIPRVTEMERSAFEAAVQADGMPGFEITEFAAGERRARAGARPDYAPWLFIEPAEDVDKMIGMDMAIDPVRREALRSARQTGAPAATTWVELMATGGVGLLVVIPTYKEEAGAVWREPKGYVMARLFVARIVDAALGEAGSGMEIAVRGGGETEYHLPSRTFGTLAAAQPRLEERLRLPRAEANLNFAGQGWEFDFRMTPRAWAASRTWEAWGVLAGGLVFAVGIGGLLLVVTGRETTLRYETFRRERVEQGLRESEARKTAVLEASLDAIISIDHRGSVLEINAATERIFGYRAGEMIGREMAELIVPPALRELHRRGMQKFLATGEGPVLGRRIELSAIRKDGSEFPIELAITRIPLDGASIFTGHIRDITERKQADEELRLSRERFELAVRGSYDGIWDLDIATGEVFFSERWCAMLGYGREELAPSLETWRQLLHPEDREPTRAAARRHLRERVPYDVEFRLRKKNGQWHWFRTRGQALWDETGRALRMAGSLTDIATRKEAERILGEAHAELERKVAERTTELWEANAELRRSIAAEQEAEARLLQQHALLLNISDSVPAELVVKDTQGRYILGNLPHRQYLRIPSQAAIQGKTAFDFFPAGIADACTADDRAVLDDKTPLLRREELRLSKDGAPAWVATTRVALRDVHKKTIGLICVTADITERKLIEERLQHSVEEKEVLLQEIHHRVKNNMQVVSSLLQLQSATLRDPETQALFQESQQRVHSMAMVHEKLYQSASLAEIDFADYLSSLARILFDSYVTDGTLVRFEKRVEPLPIDIERAVPLALIANELITNSLKYAFPGGRRGVVTLEFGAAGKGELRLAVRDDGVGVPADFDPEKGHSLGLRIVNLLTRQLRGRLTWHNGAGVNFAIDFPSGPKRRPKSNTMKDSSP